MDLAIAHDSPYISENRENTMMNEANVQFMIIAGVALFGWLMVRLVAWIKTKRINTELWCTVFEGLTQGAIRLDHLKNPETVIEKKIKKDGRDKDTLDPVRRDDLKRRPSALPQMNPRHRSRDIYPSTSVPDIRRFDS